MNPDVSDFILKNILPLVLSIGPVGYKIYYDVKRLNKQIVENKVEFTNHLNSLDVKVDGINNNISSLKQDLSNNKIEDEFRDREIQRLDNELKEIKKKIYNGNR
jgi:chromosome segregation ATPase